MKFNRKGLADEKLIDLYKGREEEEKQPVPLKKLE